MKELRSESSFSRACVKQKHVMTSLHQEAYHSFPHPRSKIVRRENLLFVLMMEKLSRQEKRDLPSARHKRPKKTFLLKKNNLKDDLSKFLQHSFITIHFNLAKEQSQSYSYWFLQKQFCFSFQSQHVDFPVSTCGIFCSSSNNTQSSLSILVLLFASTFCEHLFKC